ncbi:MAG: ion transporter [Candidatus Obscuribacterales bacterium]|nr:ion transporter [Cyanobacteria bacterium HKST-UBA01]MCB9467648.1 ion transporter [Candidatus Obscuribacterales bacterium]
MHQGAYRGTGLSLINKIVLGFICFSVGVVILETERPLYWANYTTFVIIDYTIGVLFTIEYLARLWSSGEDPRYKGAFGKLRYMVTPAALIDLLVIIPFFLLSNSNYFLARFVRLFRLFALAKFGRYSEALLLVQDAVWSRRHELFMSFILTSVILLVSSTVMWAVEDGEAFESIPRALWWGVITLTTVGYGDVYPQTVAGKICSGLTAIAGIGLIAMPAGILAAAFSEAFQRHKMVVLERREHSVEVPRIKVDSPRVSATRLEASTAKDNTAEGSKDSEEA